MCEHLEGCSMLEGGSPRNALLLCARKEDNEREREKSTQTQLDLQWECQSDRSQVIGGETPDRAVGSPGHLGHLTIQVLCVL